jgi:chaperonin cofactor prefoldin
MNISKETINSRVAELVKREQELRSELNAVVGAIQDCGYWLAFLDKADTTLME